nr:hypothetical protein [Bacilli bacterium]
MITDAQVFLVSWAQVKNALFLDPQDTAYQAALQRVEERLKEDFSIDEMQLMTRDQEAYTVAYKRHGKMHLLPIDADEIEDFT